MLCPVIKILLIIAVVGYVSGDDEATDEKKPEIEDKKSEVEDKKADIEDKSDQLEQIIIDKHNALRHKHRSAGNLTKLEDNKYTRDRCKARVGQKLSISPKVVDHKYGENVYRMTGKDLDYEKVAQAVTAAWAKHVKEYDFNKDNPDDKHLQFSQMVWKGTKEMTCAICGHNKDEKTEVTIVCNYLPAGNVKDHYIANVKESMSRSSQTEIEELGDLAEFAEGESKGHSSTHPEAKKAAVKAKGKDKGKDDDKHHDKNHDKHHDKDHGKDHDKHHDKDHGKDHDKDHDKHQVKDEDKAKGKDKAKAKDTKAKPKKVAQKKAE